MNITKEKDRTEKEMAITKTDSSIIKSAATRGFIGGGYIGAALAMSSTWIIDNRHYGLEGFAAIVGLSVTGYALASTGRSRLMAYVKDLKNSKRE